MLAPEGQREGAGLLLYLRWGEGEGEESRRRGRGERDCQGRRGRVERCRPSDDLLSLEISRWSHRERLAGGDMRRVGDEESGDAGGRLTLARCRSVEDLSRDPLCRRALLPARFEPVLCWARDASRSSEGLSCRSGLGPMFSRVTEGPTVGWGGASPTNCFQQFLMSTMNSSFHPLIISGVGPWEKVPASCCVSVGATVFTLDDGAVGIKRGVAPGKNPRKRRGGRKGLFGISSRRCRWRNRGRSHCGRSCEKAWRSTRSRRAGRKRSKRRTTDHGRVKGGAPSGPHPRRWRSHVTGCRKGHADPDVRGLGLESLGGVLVPWEGRREAASPLPVEEGPQHQTAQNGREEKIIPVELVPERPRKGSAGGGGGGGHLEPVRCP